MREVPPDLAKKLFAATEDFASTFNSVRMDDVSRTSKVPRATLYYYFASKDDLLSFLVRETLHGMAASVRDAMEGEGDGAAALARVVHAQLEYLAEHPGPAQLLAANLGKADELPELFAGLNAAFYEPLEEILVAGAKDGSLPEVDATIGAVALFGAVTMVGMRFLVLEPDASVEDVTKRLLQIFLYGWERGGL